MSSISPGIYVREFDFSQYAALLSGTVLAVVGGATKGPLNTPTVCLSEGDLVRKFGAPLTTDLGLQAAIQFLKKGSRVVFTRVADDDGVIGVKIADAKNFGGVRAAGTVTLSGIPADGNSVTIVPGNPVSTIAADSNGAFDLLLTVGNVAGGAATTLAQTKLIVGGAAGSVSSKATGYIRFDNSAQPVAGDYVEMTDPVISGVVTRFVFGPGVDNTPANSYYVTIGGTAALTMANLVAKINGVGAGLLATATDLTAGIAYEFDTDASVVQTAVLKQVDISAAGTTAFSALSALIARINATAVMGDLEFVATNTSSGNTASAKIVAGDTGDQYNATVTKVGANIAVTGLTGGVDSQHLVTFSAASPGSWANGVQVKVVEYVGPGEVSPTNKRSIQVYAPLEIGGAATLVEQYVDVSLDSTSPRYLETVLSRGIAGEVRASEYIRADVYPVGTGTTVPNGILGLSTMTLGDIAQGFTVGQDGVTGLTAPDYQGTVNGTIATGLKALRNPEVVDFNLLAVPGVSHKSVITDATALCRSRGDAVFLVDPPIGLSAEEVVDWHNGLGASLDPNAPTVPLDDSYAAVFWPWCEISDPYSKKTLWLPPSGFVAATMARSDEANGTWWAVAGPSRGVITADQIEYSADQSERDLLIGGSNRVNPLIVRGGAIQIYGNKTTQRRNTALNSLHVRRMLITAEKLCATAVQVLHFNPNDKQTWKQFTQLCNEQLDRIKAGRGIEEFRVICDESTNTPNLRQNKTMRGKLLIKPVEAAEIIQLDFALFATGSTFDETAL